jgi:hypothetical protein
MYTRKLGVFQTLVVIDNSFRLQIGIDCHTYANQDLIVEVSLFIFACKNTSIISSEMIMNASSFGCISNFDH